MLISHQKLNTLIREILRNAESDDYEAGLVADHLVMANLTGHDSHGVGMLPTYIRNVQAGLLFPGRSAQLVKDDSSFMVFDGQRGYGQRVAAESIAAAIRRCRETGLTVMALRNAHHIGRIGTYGEQCIAEGLVSLHFVNVIDHAPLVVPFGGREARYSTNPVCVALPATADTPAIILDMATSATAVGKVRVANNSGKQLPAGRVLDHTGAPTTDPAVMFREPRGALLPFGEHKGSGLGLICELLAGVLTGGGTIQPETPRLGGIVNNMLTFVIDPERLVDHDWMRTEIDAVVRYVKESAPMVQNGSVMVAGDPERKMRAERESLGIEIEEITWEEIMQAGEQVGLSRSRITSCAASD